MRKWGTRASKRYRQALLNEVFAINHELTELEIRFSNVLTGGAERLHAMILVFVGATSCALLLAALLITFRVTRLLTEGTENLRQGIARLEAGDLATQIPVLSSDELGELAATFNQLVSQRAQTQQSLDREREFLKSMLDSMSEGIAACDGDGTLTFFNRALQGMLGLPAEPIPPARWAEHYQVRLPGSRQPLPTEQMPLLRALRGEVVDNLELIIGNGMERHVLVSARRIITPAGQVLGAVAAIQDVSVRKRAEQSQRDQEAHVSAIVATAVDGVIVIDERQRITMFNPAAERIFGYRTDEVIGQNVKILMPEPYHSAHDGYVRNYFETAIEKFIGTGREVVGRRKDGSIFPMDLAVAEIKLGDRRVFTGTVRDISERKAATEAIRRRTQELERANKELEQFAFATAHDLQTPLRGLVGYAQILERGLEGRLQGDQLELLRGIGRNALSMHRLVQSLLEYTQVSTQPKRHWTNLNYLVTEVKVELQRLIRERAALIHSDALPTVFVNAQQMAQLLRSLVENAIKFQPGTEPQVWLKAQRGANEWVISVGDAGIGIPKEHHQRIFQIFQRLHASEQYEGAGIGLTLAEKIIGNHGGRIWLESEPGKGSTFFFSIPDA